MKRFENVAALRAWLAARHIDASLWGTGQAKQVTDLWHELQKRESVLQDAPLLRLVEVVQVIIRQNNRYLIEAVQEFGNGRTRQRNQPPAEKIKAGESFTHAACRCLLEELGVSQDAITLFHDAYRFVQYETDAQSYPGLRTRYTFHVIEAEVTGLPQEEFWQENQSFADGDPVRRHLWAWRNGPVPFFDRFQNDD